MSLDVYLINGNDPNQEMLWTHNITHNLTAMAEAADVCKALWRPEELGLVLAKDVQPHLIRGLGALLTNPTKFEALNPPNGWGSYANLRTMLVDYAEACGRWPEAVIHISR